MVAATRFDRCLHAAARVIFQQPGCHGVKRRVYCGDLSQDIDAIAFAFDHACDAAHLALDAGQSLQ